MDWVSRAELKGSQFLEFRDRVGSRENVWSAVGGSGSYCGVGEINHSRIEALVVLVEGHNVDFMLLEVSFEIGPDQGHKVCDVCEDGAVCVLLNLVLDFKLFSQLINLALECQCLIRFLLNHLHLLLCCFHSILNLLYTVIEASDVPSSFCQLLIRYSCVCSCLVAAGLIVFLVVPVVSFLHVGLHLVLQLTECCLLPCQLTKCTSINKDLGFEFLQLLLILNVCHFYWG